MYSHVESKNCHVEICMIIFVVHMNVHAENKTVLMHMYIPVEIKDCSSTYDESKNSSEYIYMFKQSKNCLTTYYIQVESTKFEYICTLLLKWKNC